MTLTPLTSLVVILVMGLVAFFTRIAGVLIMSRMPIGPRAERFIYAMAGSALVAIVVPLAITGDTAARVSLVVTSLVMIVTRKTMLAIFLGVVSTAAWRAFFGS